LSKALLLKIIKATLNQSSEYLIDETYNLIVAATAAPFPETERRAVTGVGAPDKHLVPKNGMEPKRV